MLIFIVWFIECAIPALSNASIVLNWLAGLTAMWYFAIHFFGLIEKEDISYYKNKMCPNIGRYLSVFMVAALCIQLLPMHKESGYKIAAAIVVQSVIDNPQIRTIAGKSYDVIDNMLDGYLQDINDKVGATVDEATKAVTDSAQEAKDAVTPAETPKKQKKSDKKAEPIDVNDVKEVAQTVSTTVKDVKEVVNTVNETVETVNTEPGYTK